MTETFFKSVPLSPEEAAAKGYAKLHVDLGDPALAFSTYARRNSLVLRRNALDSIVPAGADTVASIYVPETRNVFSTSVDAFVFEHAIEAQPCADYALTARGYELVPESGQRGLFTGGSVGILYENDQKVRGARSHAVVRGRIVLVVVMEFAIAGSDAHLEETGVFVSNLTFDAPEETRFLAQDVATLELPLPGKPFALAYPSNLTVTLNSFPVEKPAGVVLFSLGDPDNSSGFMTFGFRQDATKVDSAALDAWATRILEEYKTQNPSLLGQSKLEAQGTVLQLKNAPTTDACYLFHVENRNFDRHDQIRVAVVADRDDRYTLSLWTVKTQFKDFYHFLIYAAGVTANEIMMDSLLLRLTGSGM